MKKEIKSKKQSHENMVAIYNLMNKGQNNLTKAELKVLTAMSIATENYEETVVGLNHPFQTK
jgi:HTH-type transcriptional regulator/antitoxin HigA